MLKFSLLPKQTSKSRINSNLNETINNLITSDKFDIFKVIYIKHCSDDNEWYEKIAQYVSGMRRDFLMKYNLSVMTQTYSNNQQCYVKREYNFKDIIGYNIVDHCFKMIPEIYECDMLGIMMIGSDDPTLYRVNRLYNDMKQNDCCYIFARNN